MYEAIFFDIPVYMYTSINKTLLTLSTHVYNTDVRSLQSTDNHVADDELVRAFNEYEHNIEELHHQQHQQQLDTLG